MKKYIIFDMDGTLNQTELYVIEAYEKALLKRGKKVNKEDIIACVGLRPIEIIEKLLGNIEKEEQIKWQEEVDKYEYCLMKEKGRAFEGIKEVLTKLKSDGYGLAICSNAFLNHIEIVLDTIGILEFFDIIGSLDMGNDKKEVLKNLLSKINPIKACMVGDRIFDIEAARYNNIPVIGCAYGYAPNEIKEATIIINKPIEILEAVKQLV